MARTAGSASAHDRTRRRTASLTGMWAKPSPAERTGRSECERWHSPFSPRRPAKAGRQRSAVGIADVQEVADQSCQVVAVLGAPAVDQQAEPATLRVYERDDDSRA